MELQGTVKKIFDTQTFASGFQKKELIILTDEMYPQSISIEFLQDKINLLDAISEGENVKVGINLNGREWTSPQGEVKYFNSVIGWRVEKSDGTQPTNTSNSKSSKVPTATPQDAFEDKNENPFSEQEDDDLPF